MRQLLVIAILLFAGGIAAAQPAEPAPPPPDPQAQFDAAFAAMTRGDFAGAVVGFRAVAAAATDPELRGAARQLGRLAEDFARRGGRLSFGDTQDDAPGSAGKPPGTTGVAAVSEDDERDGGRASFVVTTTLAALYSGVVLIDLADIDDVRIGTLAVMGSTAAGLVGALYGTRGRTMTGGMADAWSLGMMVGAGNALLLSGPFGLFDSTTNTSEKIQSFVLASTWGVASAGLLVAEHYRPTRAQVSVTTTVSAMGLASTLLSLAIVQPDDLDGDVFLSLTAAGLDVSLGVGAFFAGKLDWSLSRARYVGLSAFLGGLAGVGTSLLVFANGSGESDGDNIARLAAGITLTGLWGGFALGTYLTRDMPPHARFRQRADSPPMVTPTVIRDAPGVAVVGAF
ncbi:MAG TPA: hypothetical protein VNO30_33005 [Kofleriaceae bacterium]|nr:hypothetical protein [Kofleriaceae bacterium]